ncbi:MAG TPA: TonB-dependent receptor [Terriglobales bacterium]|jgi:outer membrane receptor protein involved in Fe transport|nr:TonB-dependent receptor [Terriglobales bacterium]
MTKAVGLITFLLFFFGSAWPQQSRSLHGIVEDQSGAAVAGASVRFHSDGFQTSGKTGQDGSFELRGLPVESGTLTILAAGFAPKSQEWNSREGDSALKILLQPAGVGENIVVSATRTEMKLSDLPGSAVLLGHEDVAANPSLTLDDMLRQVPGFGLFRRSSSRVANPTSQGVSLRGLGASGPSRALVLEDGVPIVDPFGGWVYWDRIPRSEIASVEVFRGGASNLYGSDALAGVIQFVTRTPRQAAASVDLSYGNENTPDLSAWAGMAVSRWDFSSGVDLARTDGYILVPSFQRGVVDTAANSKHATVDASVGHKIGENGRAFLHGTFFDEARHNGTAVTVNSTGTAFGDAGVNTALGANDWLSARVFGLVQGYDQTFSSVTPNRSTEALTNIQHVPSQQLGTAVQWNHIWWHQTLIAGLEAQEVMGASDEQLFSSTTGNHFANNVAGGRQGSLGLFGQDLIQAGNWTVIAGLRWDRWTNTNGSNTRIPIPVGGVTQNLYPDREATAFSPKLSILRKVGSNVSVFLSGFRSFRAPTLNELYRSFRQGSTLTQANAFLGPERATGAEAGARQTAWGGGMEIRETLFWTDVLNPITNVTISTTPTLVTRERENLGRTRSVGTELDGSFRLPNHFQIAGGYQYAHAVVVESAPNLIGLNVPEVPRHQASVELRYWNPSKLMASVQGRYSGVQFDDDQNTLRLGSFYVMGLFVGREIRRGLTGYIAAENLLNRRYVVTLTGNPANPLQNWGPPILARVGLRFEFPSR